MALAMDEESSAKARLAEVIAEAWRVFGRYRFARPLEVCRCNVCVQPEEEARLLAAPVGELPALVLQSYTQSAHGSTAYADEQFRALLPRYFELCAEADWPAHSVEVTFRRLVDAGWRENWPAQEVALIDRFFTTLFAAWLADRGQLGDTEADSMLGLAAYAGGDLDPLLAEWDADRSLLASLKLSDFILSIGFYKRAEKFSPFWGDLGPLEDHVIAWLRRPETHNRLEEAFFQTEDVDLQFRISSAEILL